MNERPGMERVAGLILAGGLSRRMGGGDKALLPVAGRTLLERVIERARPQVDLLALSANGDSARFGAGDLPVLADALPGHLGPLAGILTGMEWVRQVAPDCRWLAGFAADTPLLPADLVARLAAARARSGADMACASSGGRRHPVFGLWPVALAGDLRRALAEEGLRKAGDWIARYAVAEVAWPDDERDPFFNVNTPADLDRLREHLTRGATRK